MSNRKVDTQEIYEKRRMQDGKQAKEKIPMKPESRSKLFACLAYIPFVWIVSYFAERKNEFVRFHVKQGMKLTLLTLVVGAVAWALNPFFPSFFLFRAHTNAGRLVSRNNGSKLCRTNTMHYCSFCGHHYIGILCFVRRDCSSKRKNGRIAFIRKTKT
ncbi:MAG: hypothetical protein ACLRRA_05580 [Acutalibacteraceae bacterium]